MEGTQSVVEISKSMPPPNPITQLQTRFKELETGFKAWLAKQSLPVDATVGTFIKSAALIKSAAEGAPVGTFIQRAAEGAVVGAIMGAFASLPFSPPTATLQAGLNPQVQNPTWAELIHTHDKKSPFLWCVNDVIFSRVRITEGVDVLQTSTVAAFGSGAMFSLVTGFGGPNKVFNAVRSGLFFALFQAASFQIRETLCLSIARIYYSGQRAEKYYTRTRSMLTSLGLQKYIMNFKKGLLTDSTLPLLTDCALREVKIPAGPRLVILDRIQRDSELMQARQ